MTLSASPEDQSNPAALKRIHVISNVPTRIIFADVEYEILRDHGRVRISKDKDNRVDITLVNQHCSSKASILGSFAMAEKKKGHTRYSQYFYLDWEDDLSIPEINFRAKPLSVTREYVKGQWIELGLEEVRRYDVKYADGVEAVFNRSQANGFNFTFSTGFYGSFWTEEDGSYQLNFKGDKLKPGEDNYKSQSKFIVSRSKYSGKLLLYLQESATVQLG